MNAKLEAIPGKHLVFVKYSADHCFCEEWVFNSADILHQRIVYVRPYTPESDADLAESMGDRDVWVVEPDEHPYRLQRMDPATLAATEIEDFDTDGEPFPQKSRLNNDLFDLPQYQGAAALP